MEKMTELKQYLLDEYAELRENSQNGIFAIPDYRVPHLYSKLEPYFKKAQKLEVPYTLEEIGKVILTDDENKEQDCIILKLEFAIQIKGWQFVAAIDHLENGNVIRNMSGMDLPEKFRTVKGYCEHCNTDRNRKATYVVYNEEEGFKQVGKSCLFLYTGIDLSKIASAMDIWNYIHTYSQSTESEYDEDFRYNPSNSCNAIEVLAIAWKLISKFGYVKKGSGATSTVERYHDAISYLDGTLKRYNQKEYYRLDKFYKENNVEFLTDEDLKMANKVREFIIEQKVTSDYMSNLHVIFSNFENGYCSMDKKYLAIVISAVQVYNRTMNIKSEKELTLAKEKAESKYVGNIGERVSFKIKEALVLTSWDNDFGTTFIYKIIDEQGNIFTWKTSKTPVDVIKPEFTLTGTIKEHSEYKGVKQTELQRCKIK